MGYGFYSHESISERERMPSAESFFGSGDAPVVNVLPPLDCDSERRYKHCLGIPCPAVNEDENNELDSAKNVCSFRLNSTSMKSNCLDAPPQEEDQETMENKKESSCVERLTSRCLQLELTNKMLHKKLGEQLDRNRHLQQLTHAKESTPDHRSYGRAKNHGAFDGVRDTWDVQRELLLERLKEKDRLIRKQSEMLRQNNKHLAQLEASVDALETRFSREIESCRKKIDQQEHRSDKKAEEMMDAKDEVEKGQYRIKRELVKVSQHALNDIESLEDALRHQTSLYGQAEQEKQDLIGRLNAAHKETEALKGEVLCLMENVKILKAKDRQTSHKEAHGSSSSSKGSESDESRCSDWTGSSTKNGDGVYAMKRENAELKREVLEMRERLIDLTEHSEELESQIQHQEADFNEMWNLRQELELLRRTKQDHEALLISKQNTINGLKRSFSRLQYHGDQTARSPACKEGHAAQEILSAQRQCEEMEKLLIKKQKERNLCLREAHKLLRIARSARKEAKAATRALERTKREQSDLKKSLNCKKSEIATLQTNLRVASLKRTVSRSRSSVDEDPESSLIMKELLKTKVALAEMSELVIQLRREVAFYNKLNCIAARTTYI